MNVVGALIIITIFSCNLFLSPAAGEIFIFENPEVMIERSFSNPVENPFFLAALVINYSIFVIFILFYLKKLPAIFVRPLKTLFNFETSKRVTIIVLSTMFAIYLGLTYDELAKEELIFQDYHAVRYSAEDFANSDAILTHTSSLRVVKYFLLYSSLQLFGNIRVIPLIMSIFLLIITYLITTELAKKRFAGIIATSALFQSSIFLTYDTVATYDYSWMLFYLLSLYLLLKKSYFSLPSFILSLFSKPIVVILIPASIFFAYRSNIPIKKKILIMSSYVGILVTLLVAGISFNVDFLNVKFSYDNLVFSMYNLTYLLISEKLLIILILPVLSGLFILSRRGFGYDTIILLVASVIWSGLLLETLVDISNQEYRLLPLSVFFAIGIGLIFSKGDPSNITLRTSNPIYDRPISISIFVICVPIVVLLIAMFFLNIYFQPFTAALSKID